MKKVLMILAISFVIFNSSIVIVVAQLQGQAKIDSLLKVLTNTKEDINRIALYNQISMLNYQINPDLGIEYAKKGLDISLKFGIKEQESYSYYLIGLINSLGKSNYTESIKYLNIALNSYKLLNDKAQIISCYNYLAYSYQRLSQLDSSLVYYNYALKLSVELNDKNGTALCLNNIGVVFQKKSEFSKSLDYLHQSIKQYEELGDKYGIASNYTNIGIIYDYLAEYYKSKENYEKALKYYKDINNEQGIGINHNNLGNINQKLFDYDAALYHYTMSLKIKLKLGDKKGESVTLNNIGSIYETKKEYAKALEYYDKSLHIKKELNDKPGMAYSLGNIGKLYKLLSQNQSHNRDDSLKKEYLFQAIEYLKNSITYFEEIGDIYQRFNFVFELSDAYKILEDYPNALKYFSEGTVLKDSVFNMEKTKTLANLESKRELEIKEKENLLLIRDNQLFNAELIQKNQKINLAEKEKELQHLAFLKEQAEKQEKEKQLSLSETQMKLQKSQIESMDKEKEKQNAELRAKNLQRNFFIAGVIVFVVLFFIAYIRFREKKKLSDKLAVQNVEIEKQKRIVETQKEIVEDKNNQIYASIQYAATIQHAILPWDSIIKSAFSDILIFYKPKDIVSGDSYWFQEVDGIKFLAVIDCTGHGIPGAMLTVIASTALDDAVLGKRLSDTGQILTYMNEKVTEVLNQRLAENKIRDGMEVALIAIHQEKVQFSGAGRPLYMKNGTMEIIKTDKRGIAGQTDNDEYQFSSVDIEKHNNLMLYLTSDGFADQMNEHSKKYSTKRFVALLDSISEKPITEQNQILENEFSSHKGERSQIDDVTILGVRV